MSGKRRRWSGRGEQQMPEQMLQATKWWDRQPWMLTHHQLGSDQGEVTHGKKQERWHAGAVSPMQQMHGLKSLVVGPTRKWKWDFHTIFSGQSFAECNFWKETWFEPYSRHTVECESQFVIFSFFFFLAEGAVPSHVQLIRFRTLETKNRSDSIIYVGFRQIERMTYGGTKAVSPSPTNLWLTHYFHLHFYFCIFHILWKSEELQGIFLILKITN